MIQGKAYSVARKKAGGEVLYNAPIGSTEITLIDASEFDELGGKVSIDGAVFGYTAVDMDTDILTLTTGLTAPLVEGDLIFLSPDAEYTIAIVKLDDGRSLEAVVSDTMQIVLAEGERDDDSAETVTINDDEGQPTIANVIGRPAVIDAENTYLINLNEALVDDQERLGDALTSNADAIAIATGRLATAEADIIAAKSRLTAAEAELGTLETDLGENSAAIADAEAALAQAALDLDEALQEAKTYADDKAAATLASAQASVTTLEGKVDGKANVFVQTTAPTGLVTADKGDIWINNGVTPRVVKVWTGSAWVDADSRITQAVADITKKITTYFGAAPTAPTGGFTTGDLWTDANQKTSRWSGSAWVVVSDPQALANAAQTAAIAAAASDATVKAAEAMAKANLALDKATSAQATADNAIRTYYLPAPPWADGSTQPDDVLGDMWYNDENGQAYRWNGSTWIVIVDQTIGEALSAAQSAQTTADGKITAFYLNTEPLEGDEGDLWFDLDDNNKVYRRTGTAWVSVADTRIQTQATLLTALQSDLAGVEGTLDGKSNVWVQSAQPTGLTIDNKGDIWINDGATPRVTKVWNGSAFVEADSRTTQAVADIAKKVTTFYSATTAPATPTGGFTAGDLWVNSTGKIARWSGSAWVTMVDAKTLADTAQAAAIADAQIKANAARDAAIATASADATTKADAATAVANLKNRTFTGTSAPTAPSGGFVTGDMWIDNTGKSSRWTGSAWVSVSDPQAYANTAQTNAISSAASDATTKANNAKTAAETAAKAYADTVASGASQAAIDAAAADATNKANAAQTAAYNAAVAEAQVKADAAKNAAISAAATDATTKANAATAVANTKIKTFIGATSPTGMTTGDLWIKADSSVHRYSGSAWVLATDPAALAAQAKADAAVDATTKTNAAIVTAANTAQTKADAAAATAKTQAIAEAQVKADAARDAAILAASGDATTKANTAQSNAIASSLTEINNLRALALNAAANAANLIVNPSFEAGLDGWATFGSSTPTVATGSSRSGTKHLVMTVGANAVSSSIPVNEGEIYRFNDYSRKSGTTNAGNSSYVEYSSNGTNWTLSTQISNFNLASTSGWYKGGLDYTVPAGVSFIRYRAAVSTTTNQVDVDDVSVSNVTESKRLETLANDVELRTLSRGTDLVTNGTGYMKSNYNFPGLMFDSADAPSGASGSFSPPNSNQSSITTSEFMPIDPNKSYRIGGSTRNVNSDPAAKARAYIRAIFYDVSGNVISRNTVYALTTTTLAAPLNPGDMQIKLTDASSTWWATTNFYNTYIGTWDYVDANGKAWPTNTYTRNVYMNGSVADPFWDYVDVPTNTLYLRKPWNGPAKPAGLAISAMNGGDSAVITVMSDYATFEWKNYAKTVSGAQGVGEPFNADKFPHGTASMRLQLLYNYSPVGTGNLTKFALISVSDASAANYAANNITETQITDGAISTPKIQTNAITSDKVLAGAIIAGKIATDAVDAGQIKANAITTVKIATDAIDARTVKAGAIGAIAIAAEAVDATKIKAGTIVAGNISAGAIGTTHLAADAVTADKIIAGAIGVDELAANSVTTVKIATDAIDARTVKAGSIGAIAIAAEAIDATKIKGATITGDKIAANTLTAGLIQAGAIGTAALAADSIDATKIKAGAITTVKLDAEAVTADKLKVDSLTAQKISAGVSSIIQANIGNLVVTGDTHLSTLTAQRIGADTAQFISLTVEQLTATGTSTLNNVVAQRIAADVSDLVEANIGNLTVTGDTHLNTVTAQRIGADVGSYVQLTVDQLLAGNLDVVMNVTTGGAIIVGNPTGRATELVDEGITLYDVDADGQRYPGTSLGGAASDALALLNSTGEVVSGFNADGVLTAQSGGITGDLSVGGKPILGTFADTEISTGEEGWFDQFPRGIVAKLSATSQRNLRAAGEDWGYVIIPFTAKADRLYRVYVEAEVLAATSGKVIRGYLRTKTGGADATVSDDWAAYSTSGATVASNATGLVVSTLMSYPTETDVSVLFTMRGFGTAHTPQTAFMQVEDVGPAIPNSGSYNFGRATPGGTGTPPPESPTVKTYVSTWYANGSATYAGSGNAKRTDTSGELVQGYTSYVASNGVNRSAMVFTGGAAAGETGKSITTALSGATVSKVEVYLYFTHWYYGSGGTAAICKLNQASLPAEMNTDLPAGESNKLVSGWGRGEGRWVTVDKTWFNGTNRGISIGRGVSTSATYYGRARGHASSPSYQRPRVRITYTR